VLHIIGERRCGGKNLAMWGYVIGEVQWRSLQRVAYYWGKTL